jgi:hypothetical protein
MADHRPVRFLLLHSPLVGPATWRPVAGRLLDRGHDAEVHDPRTVRADGPVVLVAHSNAGLYATSLGERLDVRATVYVDAALPDEGGSDTALAPAAMVEHLATLADPDGLLPPWSRWWRADELAGLFPDEATRLAVQREEPRLPLAYFAGRVPVPPGWTAQPAAYLAFGRTYADETARARGYGWPVEVIAGRHLHQLVDPAGVASLVVALADRAKA